MYIKPDHTIKDFQFDKKVIYVLYVPSHYIDEFKKGKHKDCEKGIISSMNDKFVFVKYYRNGVLQNTAQATDPKDLIKL